MGNHEYCSDCGASDYHLGQPCNPAEKAKHQAWKADGLRVFEAGFEKLKTLETELQARGFTCLLDPHRGLLTVYA